jgi:hypothetical protein
MRDDKWSPSQLMSSAAPNRILSRRLETFAVVALLFYIGIWTGCAGVSAGSPTPLPAGTLSMGASSLGFGTVESGNSKTLTINATNSGSAPVTISAASISTSAFSLMSTLPVTVAAGQSTTLSIKFTPPGSGTFNATLALTSNASNSLIDTPLTGSGGSDSSLGQLTLNPTSESFGSVTVGQQQPQSVTLTNTGGANVDISQASISGTGFQLSGITAPLTLIPNQSTTFSVAFAPNATGAASGTVTIVSDASNSSLTMSLSGTGLAPGDLSPNPGSLAFNTVTVGNNKSISETVTNTGGTSVTVSNVAISGTGFTLSGITAPVTLTAGQGATFSVKFTPGSAGSASGTVTVTSNATNSTLAIPLSGTGANPVGTLTAAPATLPVGSVVVGTSGEAQGGLTASGASVTVSAAATNNSEFVVSGVSLPVTIAAGQTVNYTVTFTPSATGSASATLTFTSNANPATTTETLTGTGTAAPIHSVSLQWNASTSENVSGYNVYRAVFASGACGVYGKINSQLNTGLLYTDSNVVDGTSYCYASTAVNTSQEESIYSNIASNVQIPAP